jgi:hypothetical protein
MDWLSDCEQLHRFDRYVAIAVGWCSGSADVRCRVIEERRLAGGRPQVRRKNAE